MATIPALPPTLHEKLTSLARRIRMLRALRGVSLLVLTLVLTGGVALLADGLVGLPAPARAVLLLTWLAAGAVVSVSALLIPVCRRLDPEALAALIEEKYPELGERLTSAVELAEHPGSYHGSPALVALLFQETEVRTHRLNFLQTFPARSIGRLAGGAALALVLMLAPAFLWPGRCTQLAERFLFPWRVPQVLIPYVLEVVPGDVVTAKDRPLTLAVQVHPRDSGVALPPASTLVQVDGAGKTTRLRMLADRPDAFSLRLERVTQDFQYYIEAGDAISTTYRVSTVEPVELASDSPTITITPPDYAKAVLDAENIHGLVDLSALQYSRIALDFHFTRPAIAARLQWSGSANKDGDRDQKTYELDTSPDRRSARLELPALVDGSYQLVLEAEHGIRTEIGPHAIAVKVDHPPAFLKPLPAEPPKPEWKLQADPTGRQFRPVEATELPKMVVPYDSVPVDITIADDLAVDRAAVEYRINDGPVLLEEIPLQGQGARQASARHLFRLAEKALKEGDTVRYRLNATDNRRVPEANLGPQVTYYPGESRWLSLKIASQAEPLRQQEIIAQRDEINRRLEAIKSALQKEQRGVYKVRQEGRDQSPLAAEQAKDLKQLRQENRSTENTLRDLARETGESPALQPIADLAQQLADRELHRSGEALRESEKDVKPEPRDRDLQKAEQELAMALQRLEELRRANEQVAQARAEQMKLEMLAEREQGLAERTAEQAQRDPVKEPERRTELEQLKREQEQLTQEAQQLADKSEPLRNALDANRAEQARQMAERARDLAQAQRDVSEATRQTQQRQNEGRLAALAQQQQDLAERAARLAQETQPAAQAAQAKPLKPEEAQKAADSLKKDNAGEALQHQDQSLRELERVATGLQRAVELARDPREAARQLARLEENLRQQLKDQVKKHDPKVPMAKELQSLQQEQEAIRAAIKNLPLPQHNESVQKERKEASDRATKAATALYKPDPADADARLQDASQALERLANSLRPLPERQQQAREEIARLRGQQAEIARQADQALQSANKESDPVKARDQLARPLAEAARRQADSAERLAHLDTPGQDVARQQAQEALNRALAGLLDGQTKDIPASQQHARQELERLEQALNGRKPAEEQHVARYEPPKPDQGSDQANSKPRQAAQELAKKQRQLAEATQQARSQTGDKVKQALDRIQQEQRQLNERASRLPLEQAPRAQAEARTTMNQAEQALAKQDANQAQQKQTEAAIALDRLTQQLPERSAEMAQERKPESSAPPPQGMPSRERAEQAQQLAQQQRELRDAVRKLIQQPASTEASPVMELARKQQELAQEAGELARQVGQEQGRQTAPTQQAQQAAQTTQQAAKRMQAGALQPAQQSGQQAAQQLRQLAQKLSQTPRPPDPNAPETMERARDLAQQQEEINRQLEPLAQDTKAQQAQQQARQQELQRQSGELARQLTQLAPQMNRPPQAQQSTQQAAARSEQGQVGMQRAQEQGRQGNQGAAQQSQQQAAQALDQAARLLDQAAQQTLAAHQPSKNNQPAEQQAGQALQQAQVEMAQAQSQLNQNQSQAAQNAMHRAAQALQQVSQQLAQQSAQQSPPNPNSQPTARGAAGAGEPNANLLGEDLKQYAGKRWGELSGELRTKVIQDMKARYGDDYARIIKLYFEQIADTKK